MLLKKLLDNIEYKIIQGNINIDIKDISYDSRNVCKNYAFICLIGIDTDGHNYIEDAIKNGANCIIICKDVQIKNKDITIIKIKDTRTELSYISANLFNHPQDKLIKIGITGTKGKTSTSWMIKSILEQNNEKVGVIGTLGTYIDNKKIEHKNTTPESYLIQKYMKEMVDNNIKYLIMETSSTALKVGRINNITFDYGIFTNLSLDHVGPREHKDYEDYKNSKIKLFKQSKIGIINSDDIEYENIKKQSTCKIYTYGTTGEIQIKNIQEKDLGIEFELDGLIKDKFKINTPGIFSAYNAASAIIVTKLLNIEKEKIKKGLENFKVSGRCEIIKIKNYHVVIDYAHNKLSMESIIQAMKRYPHNKIITIFGCGGGRDKIIRKNLGKTSGNLSDLSIITTDNPRYDNNEEILKDIEEGIKTTKGEYKIIKDRKEAIINTLKQAKENDIILILGKGHENYQEIKGKRQPFDERQIINNYLKDSYNKN